MTTNIDTIKLTGRPGTEPVVRQLNNNKMMARFAFASSEEITDEAGKTVQTTRWHQVVAWGKCAALVQQKVKKAKRSASWEKMPAAAIPTKKARCAKSLKLCCTTCMCLNHK